MVADLTVLVVGAGPTGLLLAAELHRRGGACRVIDANPAPLHWDRATVVHPRSLEVFESLGIVEPLLAKGVRQRIARLHSSGVVLGEIDLALCGSRYPFNIGISEEVTESILTDYLERQGGAVIRSSRLVDISEHEDSLIATVERDGVTEDVSASWIVGCDGVHSVTRLRTGIELAGHDLTEPWAVFDATLPGWSDTYEGNFAYLDEIPVILTALPQQRWRVYLRPGSDASDLVADACSTLRRYLPALALEDVTHPMRFHCHNKVARRYRAGRILLAGDAAHVCSPSQGHGMNSGLQDAFNLAWKLALVCHGHCAPAILDSYEAERRPVAEMITASGEAFEQTADMTDPAERRRRDESLRALFADPTSRHHEAIAEAELDIDYAASPIVMGEKHAALAPGQRLPGTIEVFVRNGETRLLHELAHRAGHTALVIGGRLAQREQLARVANSVVVRNSAPIIEATVVLTTLTDETHSDGRLSAQGALDLGVDDVTLLVIRPDGHVGLRADRDHVAAVTAYHERLASGGV